MPSLFWFWHLQFIFPPGSWSGSVYVAPFFLLWVLTQSYTFTASYQSQIERILHVTRWNNSSYFTFQIGQQTHNLILFSARNSTKLGHFQGTDYLSGISFCNSSSQYSLQKPCMQCSLFSECWLETRGALYTWRFYPEIFMEEQDHIRVSDYRAAGDCGKTQVQGRTLFVCFQWNIFTLIFVLNN